MGIRRKSREAALKILYKMDVTREWDASLMVEEYFEENPETGPEERDFTQALAAGVAERLAGIDAELGACLTNWPVDRLGYMERNILRLGAFEILYQDFTPDKVAVDEAVELSKVYCDKESSKLINGVLQRVMDRKGSNTPPGEPGEKLAV